MAPDNPDNKVSGAGVSGNHSLPNAGSFFVAPNSGDEFNTIKVPLEAVACWRVEDIRFAFDSSFIMPDAQDEFTDLYTLKQTYPDAPLSIFGHADPVSNDAYNKTLSGRRAQSVYAVLTRNTDLWEELYKNPHGHDTWDTGEIQVMLSALGHYAGPISGDNDTATKDAVKKYQTEKGLKVDGVSGQNTRRELFKEYMDFLCADTDGKPFQLDPGKDFLAQGADKKGKGDYQGCGEFNPRMIFSEEEHKKYSKPENKAARDSENAPNRRVIVFLYKTGSRVSSEKWPCPRVSEGIEGCKKHFWSDGEQRRSKRLPSERREFDKGKDTFACLIYHRFATHSPCEGAGVDKTACQPTFFTLEQPGSSKYVRMHALIAYVLYFKTESTELEKVEPYDIIDGKLCGEDGNPAKLECGRDTWLYFSHLEELHLKEREARFKKDKTGFSLLGPYLLPAGPEAKVELNIWEQKDWLIVRAPELDGDRINSVRMAEWREDYEIGHSYTLPSGEQHFRSHGSSVEKDTQEKWDGNEPVRLRLFGKPDGNPMWIGTLPFKKRTVKLILLGRIGIEGPRIHVGSYNEIVATGDNQDFPGHHIYNQGLVNVLLRLPEDLDDDNDSAIDALPEPPGRFLLPGDMCWQDQQQTNHCGAFSFSTAMNYWYLTTNNPGEKDGFWYAQPGRVDARPVPAGARTPEDIRVAAKRFQMHGRMNNAEDIDKHRALKVLKLWLQAGVPVLFLVKETRDVAGSIFEEDFWSYHWKVVIGYNGNRFFMNNSGADREELVSRRTPGVEYEKAPVGNDVDSDTQFYTKWKEGGGDIVDAIFAPSVNECTFIPIYPKEPRFSGKSAR